MLPQGRVERVNRRPKRPTEAESLDSALLRRELMTHGAPSLSRFIKSEDTLKFSRDRRILRCTKDDWPKDPFGRRAWPSFPNSQEYIAMLGKGRSNTSLFPIIERVNDYSISFDDYHNDIRIRRHFIQKNVFGIRPSWDIPEKFSKYFRYRWGFLILIDCFLPTQLVNYLSSTWLRDRSSLWLDDPRPLRKFLKSCPKPDFVR
jgi:hypothetical protein